MEQTQVANMSVLELSSPKVPSHEIVKPSETLNPKGTFEKICQGGEPGTLRSTRCAPVSTFWECRTQGLEFGFGRLGASDLGFGLPLTRN